MSNKERVLRALAHQEPDRVPCDYIGTLEVDEKLREYFKIHAVEQIDSEEGGARWNTARAKNMEEVLKKLQIDLRQVNPEYCGPPIEKFHDSSYKDIWGITYRKISNEFGKYDEAVTLPFAGLKTLSDIENYPWPSPDWYDYDSVYEQCISYEGYAIKAGGGGVMDLINGISRGRGMQQVLVDVALEDPVGLYIFDRRFDFYYEYTRRTLQAGNGKVDIFWFGDDYGTQRGLLLNPRAWKKIFKPYLKRMVDLIHSFNVKVMFHSCGSTAIIWDDLTEIGVDIYQTVQERAEGMNPEELKLKYGHKICFHGAIDSQGFLQTARPDEVKKVVRQRAQTLGRNGGYICASCHNLQPDVPVKNIIAMYETINES